MRSRRGSSRRKPKKRVTRRRTTPRRTSRSSYATRLRTIYRARSRRMAPQRPLGWSARSTTQSIPTPVASVVNTPVGTPMSVQGYSPWQYVSPIESALHARTFSSAFPSPFSMIDGPSYFGDRGPMTIAELI